MFTNVMYVVSRDIAGFTDLSTVTLSLVLIPRQGKVCAFDSLFLLVNLICYGVYTWPGGF
jgi:hypothetical protein